MGGHESYEIVAEHLLVRNEKIRVRNSPRENVNEKKKARDRVYTGTGELWGDGERPHAEPNHRKSNLQGQEKNVARLGSMQKKKGNEGSLADQERGASYNIRAVGESSIGETGKIKKQLVRGKEKIPLRRKGAIASNSNAGGGSGRRIGKRGNLRSERGNAGRPGVRHYLIQA